MTPPMTRDIDQIIDAARRAAPDIEVNQLKVLHPGADDDGLWFLRRPGCPIEIQLESATGMCPFLIETDENNDRITANSIEDSIKVLLRLLHV